MKAPFFLLPGLVAWGEPCSTVDGVAGKPAAADERLTVGRRWSSPHRYQIASHLSVSTFVRDGW